MMSKTTIQERLEWLEDNAIRDFCIRLKTKYQQDYGEKVRIADIKTPDGIITLSWDKHFYYLNDNPLIGCLTSEEMFEIQKLLFNIFFILYGDGFKPNPEYLE